MQQRPFDRPQLQITGSPNGWIREAAPIVAVRTAPARDGVAQTLREGVAAAKALCHGLHLQTGSKAKPRISFGRYSNPAGLFRPGSYPFVLSRMV